MNSPRGAYTADRAAALAGVPHSTLHYWAREEILVPSISAERVKLWSYVDLMSLRTIKWLRDHKSSDDGDRIPASSMSQVRKALSALAEVDLTLWTEASGPRVLVDLKGDVHVSDERGIARVRDQQAPIEGTLDLIAPFLTGPDLKMPRPSLRIVPGKLGGAPHIANTRIETEALAALHARGMPTKTIAELYPMAPRSGIDDALELEDQLVAAPLAA